MWIDVLLGRTAGVDKLPVRAVGKLGICRRQTRHSVLRETDTVRRKAETSARVQHIYAAVGLGISVHLIRHLCAALGELDRALTENVGVVGCRSGRSSNRSDSNCAGRRGDRRRRCAHAIAAELFNKGDNTLAGRNGVLGVRAKRSRNSRSRSSRRSTRSGVERYLRTENSDLITACNSTPDGNSVGAGRRVDGVGGHTVVNQNRLAVESAQRKVALNAIGINGFHVRQQLEVLKMGSNNRMHKSKAECILVIAAGLLRSVVHGCVTDTACAHVAGSCVCSHVHRVSVNEVLTSSVGHAENAFEALNERLLVNGAPVIRDLLRDITHEIYTAGDIIGEILLFESLCTTDNNTVMHIGVVDDTVMLVLPS